MMVSFIGRENRSLTDLPKVST